MSEMSLPAAVKQLRHVEDVVLLLVARDGPIDPEALSTAKSVLAEVMDVVLPAEMSVGERLDDIAREHSEPHPEKEGARWIRPETFGAELWQAELRAAESLTIQMPDLERLEAVSSMVGLPAGASRFRLVAD